MEFYGVAVVVVHCPFLWPFTGFPHLEHVYIFVLQVKLLLISGLFMRL